MLPTPAIIKNLFIPDFKKHMKNEITTLAKNIKGGSNFKQILKRVGEGMGAITKAGGAEAAQEYAQTWGEAINTQLVPGEREDFWKSVKEMFTDKQNNLDALAGSFLGGGAGGTIKSVTTVPAVTAGAAIDTTKGTAKVAAKTAAAGVKGIKKVASALANNAAYKVLSQEERNVIASEHNSRSQVVELKAKALNNSIETVNAAGSIQEMRADKKIGAVANKIQQEQGVTDADLNKPKALKKLKDGIVRAYKADIALMRTNLAAQAGAAIAAKTAKNVGSAASDAATATVRAVSPGVKAVVDTVKQYGPEAVKAVKELRSSTALGIIELSANAGKEQTKDILEAAKTMSMDDLQRTAAVVANINPDVARGLDQLVRTKNKALERTGRVVKDIVDKHTLSKAVVSAAKLDKIETKDVASMSVILNEATAGVLGDLDSLNKIERVAKLIERTEAFRNQTDGAMSRDSMVIVKRKLNRSRARLMKEQALAERSLGTKAVDKAAEGIEAVKPIIKKAGEKITKKAGEIGDKIEEAAKERAAANVKVSPGFQAVIDAVITTLKDPAQEDALVASAPDFVKQMKRYGVNNRAEFVLFIEQNPELNENMQFFQALDAQYPSNIIADEVSDVLSTLLLSGEQSIRDAYNRMNPPECKV
jgi:hypothetical protein